MASDSWFSYVLCGARVALAVAPRLALDHEGRGAGKRAKVKIENSSLESFSHVLTRLLYGARSGQHFFPKRTPARQARLFVSILHDIVLNEPVELVGS